MLFWRSWTMLQHWPTINCWQNSWWRGCAFYCCAEEVCAFYYTWTDISLGHHEQWPTETIDNFADALVLHVNCAYLGLDTEMRMRLALAQFMYAIRNDHIQDTLLQSPLENLDIPIKQSEDWTQHWLFGNSYGHGCNCNTLIVLIAEERRMKLPCKKEWLCTLATVTPILSCEQSTTTWSCYKSCCLNWTLTMD